MSNPDIRMTEPMEIVKEDLPEVYKGVQEYLMDNFSEVPNELDPQLAWLVRNMAYQRALIIKQQQKIDALMLIVEVIAEDVYSEAGIE
jgi:hypothetical protein